jgi:hypothetical protein
MQYGSKEVMAWLSMIKGEKTIENFESLVSVHVGDGSKVLFWRDRWIQGRAATNYELGITQHVSKHHAILG